MLSTNDVKAIRNIIKEELTDAITGAVSPLVTKEEAKALATKDDLKRLAAKADVARLDTHLTKFEVKITQELSDLKNHTTKNFKKLEKCIKTERKLRNEDFGH